MLQVELDYKLLLTELIRKQISILGPDITLSRAKSIKGLVFSESSQNTSTPIGEIASFNRDPALIVQDFIDSFVDLYGRPAERAIEPILIHYGYSFGQTNTSLYTQSNASDLSYKPIASTEKKDDVQNSTDTPMQELNKLIGDINKNLMPHKSS